MLHPQAQRFQRAFQRLAKHSVMDGMFVSPQIHVAALPPP